MHLVVDSPKKLSVLLILRQDQEERLQNTCFRGPHLHLAGNLKRDAKPLYLFSGTLFRDELLRLTEELWNDDQLGNHCLTIDCGRSIGWESTAPLEDYTENELELFYPNDNENSRWWGRRVKTSLTDLAAPITSLLTIRFYLERQRGKPVVVIQSLYPGVAIGHLHGDMTDKTGRVFFDWNHPGAPWPD